MEVVGTRGIGDQESWACASLLAGQGMMTQHGMGMIGDDTCV